MSICRRFTGFALLVAVLLASGCEKKAGGRQGSGDAYSTYKRLQQSYFDSSHAFRESARDFLYTRPGSGQYESERRAALRAGADARSNLHRLWNFLRANGSALRADARYVDESNQFQTLEEDIDTLMEQIRNR